MARRSWCRRTIGLEVGNDLEPFDEIGKDLLDDLGRSLDLLEKDLVAHAGREVEEAQQTATIVKSRAFEEAFAQQPPAAVERAEEATASAKDQAARGKKLAADVAKAFAQLKKGSERAGKPRRLTTQGLDSLAARTACIGGARLRSRSWTA